MAQQDIYLTHGNDASDVIAELLSSIRMRGTIYCRSELRSPWGITISDRINAGLHLVTQGGCWLEVSGLDQSIRLEAGDIVLLPRDRLHTLRDDPASHARRLDDLFAESPPVDSVFRFGGDGPMTILICGGLWLEEKKTNLLLSSLPPVIHLRGKSIDSAGLKSVVQSIESELGKQAPGTRTIISRLTETLFIYVVRQFFAEAARDDVPLLRALRDPQIASALLLIHQKPAWTWTIESLGREVGMSRSAFSARFSELVGETVYRYITRRRINEAASYLATTEIKLSDIATMVGYESEGALSKVFKKYVGVTPTAYRQAADPKVTAKKFTFVANA